MKIGIEVEGRFKGLRTLFMSADEFLSDDSFKVPPSIQQVYISDPRNRLDLQDEWLLELANRVQLTIERTALALSPPPVVHVILHVHSPSFWLLKKTDQVKFMTEVESPDWASHRVRTFVCESAFVTEPIDYSGDCEV